VSGISPAVMPTLRILSAAAGELTAARPKTRAAQSAVATKGNMPIMPQLPHFRQAMEFASAMVLCSIELWRKITQYLSCVESDPINAPKFIKKSPLWKFQDGYYAITQ